MIGIGRPRWREVSGAPQRRGPLRSNHRPGRILLLSSKVMARICYFPFLNRNRGDKDPSLLSQNCSCGFDLRAAGRLVGAAGQKKTKNQTQPACHPKTCFMSRCGTGTQWLPQIRTHTSEQFPSVWLFISFAGLLTGKLAFASNSHLWGKKMENFSFHLCH